MALTVTPTDEMKTLKVGEKIYEVVDDNARTELTEVKADLNKKANQDGYYQDMSVGTADQLNSTQYVEDSVPYLFRTTGGSADVGDRADIRAIVGGSLVWNQALSVYAGTRSGVTIVDTGNGIAELSGIVDTTYVSTHSNVSVVNGHKYFLASKILANPNNVSFNFSAYNLGRGAIITDGGGASIFIATQTKVSSVGITEFNANTNLTGIKIRAMFIDLTAMFGSTIADYIYSLEQASAGAGVAWFRKLFPADYYPFDAGTLKHVEGLSAHNTVGFNQWDGETANGYWDVNTGAFTPSTNWMASKNHIPVLPDTQYYIKGDETKALSFGALVFYDADKKYISGDNSSHKNTTFTTPKNCHYMTFYANPIYKDTDICINLSWSGWRNGEYKPYVKHSYPLDSSVVLRGIPKLDSANNLYYDGDRYLPDGVVERRYGIVDLGTLNWVHNGENKVYASIASKKIGSQNIIADNFTRIPAATDTGFMANGQIKAYADNRTITLFLTGINAGNASTMLSGKYLVYELAEPTTETADPYQETQIVDDFGTEEFVSTGIIPVGHETRYPANLRDKLQHLPDLADGDGYYMISQSGHQMTLEHFRIPKAPTTDGTYTLKATVSGGTPTYTWVEESTNEG